MGTQESSDDPQLLRQVHRDLGVYPRTGLFAFPSLFIALYALSSDIRALGAFFWLPACVVVGFTAGRLVLAARLASSPPDRASHPVVRSYVWLSWLTALGWGLTVGACLETVGYRESTYLLIISTAGIGAGAVSTLGVSERVIVPYILLLLSPVFIESLLLTLRSRGPSVMPVMVAMFTAFALSTSIRLCRAYRGRLTALRESDAALAGARAATEAKSRFLASVSHEIRTPMNGIIGIAHLLKETDLDEEQAELLSTIEGASQSLLRIINDILDLSKVEAGKLDFVDAPFSPVACVEDLVGIMEPVAHGKNLELSVWFAQDLPDEVMGDVCRVQQILLNLVNNAVKFTNEGGVHVEVLCRVPPPGLRFTVTDTGPGLEPDLEPFVAFSQGDGGRIHGGTGLGLAISHRLTQLMGGAIGFERPDDGGTRFWFEIPVPTHRPRRDPTTSDRAAWVIDPWPPGRASTSQLLRRCGIQAVAATLNAGPVPPGTDVLIAVDRVTEDMKSALTRLRSRRGRVVALTTRERRAQVRRALGALADHVATRPLTHGLARRVLGADVPAASRPPSNPNPGATSATKRVLIVEDNAVNQMLAQRFVEAAGFDTGIASSGPEALEHFTEHRWQAILMDCRMPGMDGWQTTRAIRALESGSERRVPIIAMTADVQEGAKERCFGAGMDEFLSKPVDPAELAAVLRRLTES